MKFTNRQFGEMEFGDKHVLRFQEGIIGFGDSRDFLIVDDEESQPFRWLVSLEDSDLSFAMIEAGLVLSDYEEKYFGGKNVSVFLFVALREPVEESTMNLRSPLVIDNSSRSGQQVVLEDEALSMRFPLFTRRPELVE